MHKKIFVFSLTLVDIEMEQVVEIIPEEKGRFILFADGLATLGAMASAAMVST